MYRWSTSVIHLSAHLDFQRMASCTLAREKGADRPKRLWSEMFDAVYDEACPSRKATITAAVSRLASPGIRVAALRYNMRSKKSFTTRCSTIGFGSKR